MFVMPFLRFHSVSANREQNSGNYLLETPWFQCVVHILHAVERTAMTLLRKRLCDVTLDNIILWREETRPFAPIQQYTVLVSHGDLLWYYTVMRTRVFITCRHLWRFNVVIGSAKCSRPYKHRKKKKIRCCCAQTILRMKETAESLYNAIEMLNGSNSTGRQAYNRPAPGRIKSMRSRYNLLYFL